MPGSTIPTMGNAAFTEFLGSLESTNEQLSRFGLPDAQATTWGGDLATTARIRAAAPRTASSTTGNGTRAWPWPSKVAEAHAVLHPDAMVDDSMRAQQAAVCQKLGLPVAQRHIFLCADPSNPKCCDRDRGLAAWDFLKARLKELGLSEAGGVQRTKANCLRLCSGGPIAVVYPDGTWYGDCDPPVLEQIVQRHLLRGEVVTEHLITTAPLAAARPPQ